ncbi:hypothetical protein ILYODFUR_007733 [Ilyodon furcidens]|uniref:Uncharacterized protein n=1 Tax=Ilyodon furcidens TaxID=33524 RepID=A0ABV0T685_9TELE
MNHCIFPSRLAAPRKMAFTGAYFASPPNIDSTGPIAYWKNDWVSCLHPQGPTRPDSLTDDQRTVVPVCLLHLFLTYTKHRAQNLGLNK